MSTQLIPKAVPPHGTLLSGLAEAVRQRGGTALVRMADSDFPVLYVRERDRVVTVVVIQRADGGHAFLWGRTAYVDVAAAESVADHFTGRPSRIQNVSAAAPAAPAAAAAPPAAALPAALGELTAA